MHGVYNVFLRSQQDSRRFENTESVETVSCYISYVYKSVAFILYICTLPLKSLLPLASVWSKTTLNTGPSNLKNVDRFSYVLGTSYANFQQFPLIWSFGRNSQTKISTFIVVKSGNFCLRVSPEDSFYWKLLKIGIRSGKDITKDVPIFQV